MNIAFFANGERYVMQAELLAQSIRYFLPDAYLRWYYVNSPEHEVRRMERAGVLPSQISMPHFLDGYWLGMKAVACAAAAADFGGAFWFVDSDVIAFGPIKNGLNGIIQSELIGDLGFQSYGSWIDEEVRAQPWQKAERLFNYVSMDMPGNRTYEGYWEGRRARMANNSGVIWIGDPLFGSQWVDTLEQLIENNIYISNRYFQEQWSFSVTLTRFNHRAWSPGPEHPEVERPKLLHYAGFKPDTVEEIREYILALRDSRKKPLLEAFDAVAKCHPLVKVARRLGTISSGTSNVIFKAKVAIKTALRH